jgi:hypothetical protein
LGFGKKCSISSQCRSLSRMPTAWPHALPTHKCLIRDRTYL